MEQFIRDQLEELQRSQQGLHDKIGDHIAESNARRALIEKQLEEHLEKHHRIEGGISKYVLGIIGAAFAAAATALWAWVSGHLHWHNV